MKNILKILTLVAIATLVVFSCKKDLSDNNNNYGNHTDYQVITTTYVANGVDFYMVDVLGGSFTIGDSTSSLYAKADGSHRVRLNDYSIGKYEVTQKLWYAVMGNWVTEAPSYEYGLGDNFPMYGLSLNDIVGTTGEVAYTIYGVTYRTDGFCAKLTNLVNNGYYFRLPTEAEWEYAALGSSMSHKYDYAGGDTIGQVAWYRGNSDKAQIVGGKAENELGLCDMSGNIAEWCSDWHAQAYRATDSLDASGVLTGENRVLRGGTWELDKQWSSVISRVPEDPASRNKTNGFRLAYSKNMRISAKNATTGYAFTSFYNDTVFPVRVFASNYWTVETDQDWVHLNTNYGIVNATGHLGDDSLAVRLEECVSERTARIDFSSNGQIMYTINLLQHANNYLQSWSWSAKGRDTVAVGKIDTIVAIPKPANAVVSVSWSSSDESVATVEPIDALRAIVRIHTAGTATVTGVIDGTGTSSAIANKTCIYVAGSLQTITWNQNFGELVAGNTIELTATATSGLPVTYTTKYPAVTTVTGNTLTVVGVGTDTIIASQAGDATWFPAHSVIKRIVVRVTK